MCTLSPCLLVQYMDPDGASAAIDALHGKAICKNSQPLIMEVSQEVCKLWKSYKSYSLLVHIQTNGKF